jgi:predicted nucleotidyltransferase
MGGNMLEELFSSAARVKVLALFLTNPENKYYLRQACKLSGLPVMAVQRELNKLVKIGLLSREASGNRVYFQVSKGFPIYKELKEIMLKTTGLGDTLTAMIARSKEVDAAFIFGSYAEGNERKGSDIDLFVIGKISARKLQEGITRASAKLRREIVPVLYSAEEYKKEKQKKNHFIVSLLDKPKIFLKGSQDDL